VFSLLTETIAVIHRLHSGYDFIRTDADFLEIQKLRYKFCKFRFGKAGIFVKTGFRGNVE
jgi:hypothetical protein